MIQSHKSYSKIFSMLALGVSILLSGATFLYGNAASACTTNKWPTVNAGQACDTATGQCPRYQGQCSYEAMAGSANFVQHGAGADGAAGTATDVRSRFYVFLSTANPLVSGNSLSMTTGELAIFRAINGATTVIEVAIRPGSPFEAVVKSNNNTSAAIALTNGWHSFEVQRNSATNQVTLIVDGNTAGAQSVAGNATAVADFQFGAIESTGNASGKVYVDSVVTNRTTSPTALIVGDANGSNAAPDVNDILAVADEAFGNPSLPANGNPDCNGDGDININDILCIADIAFP